MRARQLFAAALVTLSICALVVSVGPARATASAPLVPPIVAVAARSDGGAWSVTSSGLVQSRGGAPLFGDVHQVALNRPIVGIAGTPDGAGYWLVASDGGVFTFGDARFHGSAGSIRLNRPIVGIVATPDGAGYWLVASDGGIFSYGDAQFY